MEHSATGESSPPGSGLPSNHLRKHYIIALRRIIHSIRGFARLGAEEDYDDIYIIPSRSYQHVFSYIGQDVMETIQSEKQSLHCMDISESLESVHSTGRMALVYLTFAKADEVEAVTKHAEKLFSAPLRSTQFNQTHAPSIHLFVFGEFTDSIRSSLVMYQRRNAALPPINIAKFPAGFLSLDSDLLILGQTSFLFDLFVRNDYSALESVVTVLQEFQHLFGFFESVKCKGQLAITVANGLMACMEQKDFDRNKQGKKRRDRRYTLVLLDRSVDLVSPLMTPLTYHALLDQIYGNEDEFMHVDSTAIPVDPQAPTSFLQVPNDRAETFAEVLEFNSADPIFSQVRSSSIDKLPDMLKELALEMKCSFQRFQSTANSATISDIQKFVKTIPSEKIKQQKLEVHTKLAEDLLAIVHSNEFRSTWNLEREMGDASVDEDEVYQKLENRIISDISLTSIFRLICLFSLVRGGLAPKKIAQCNSLIQQKHGTIALQCIKRLLELGILKVRSNTRRNIELSEALVNFQLICKNLNLIELNACDHLAYVTGGYAPISCRLAEEIGRCGNWLEIDSTMKLLKGARVEMTTCTETRIQTTHSLKTRVIVVCVLGGITHTEIAGLRWLSTIYSCDFVIMATSICNSKTFLSRLIQDITNIEPTEQSENPN
uniref:Vacuolar protein sortingassociated protein putative n=1 Tax=Albugo laibachii Nc14 TaxID=890382 RepID=F0WX14_9STRA|nr:vacuolar protein sortingassociated protein putative [Albugo laibachii Nc14]|eukprot:CCA26002.1 vacuolar protein sortingassociated protein putative [Albugo laibachii Nc14]